MVKIQKLSGLQPTIAFNEFDFFNLYQESFSSSELGDLHRSIPWQSLAASIGLKENSLGRSSFFSPTGKLALMFLKSYTELSDSMLVENLNSNIHYQIFCGVRVNPVNPLTNFKIVSQIRCEVASLLDVKREENILAEYWKPYLQELSILMTDATCYESYIRFPTDIKLLWESVEWLHKEMCSFYKAAGLRKPRTKYDKQSRKYRTFSKMRKPGQSRKQVLKRSLLHLLNKLTGLTDGVLASSGKGLEVSNRFEKRFHTVKEICRQQHLRFAGQKVSHRIVSIDKPYIRPIVRGKEVKKVEFGAKVNTIQVNGINFIEHISFEAFNEGTRIPQCISRQQELFRRKVNQLAADSIYASNANRKYCRKRNITTSFVRKGRAGKNEQQYALMRSILSKERSTRLEGSFGTEKCFYGLNKVKARTEETEILWIFFGIHTANAVRMISKMNKIRDQIPDSA